MIIFGIVIITITTTLFLASAQNVYLAVNYVYFASMKSTDLDQLSPEIRHNWVSWEFFGFDVEFPSNTYGRYVYAYVSGGGDMYIAEIEIYGPINYGENCQSWSLVTVFSTNLAFIKRLSAKAFHREWGFLEQKSDFPFEIHLVICHHRIDEDC